MKDKIIHHWNENIKPGIFIVLAGMLIVVGMRLAELIWPKTAAKVLICISSDVGKVEACRPFLEKKHTGG